jgi:hypothetical protein
VIQLCDFSTPFSKLFPLTPILTILTELRYAFANIQFHLIVVNIKSMEGFYATT